MEPMVALRVDALYANIYKNFVCYYKAFPPGYRINNESYEKCNAALSKCLLPFYAALKPQYDAITQNLDSIPSKKHQSSCDLSAEKVCIYCTQLRGEEEVACSLELAQTCCISKFRHYSLHILA